MPDATSPARAVPGAPGAAGGRRASTARFDAKRERILAAAARQFNALGLRGATLAGIAAEVGLNTTSLIYYYPRKEALAAACYLRAIALHRGQAEAALQAGPTLAERVMAFVLTEAALPAAVADGQMLPLIEFHDLPALNDGDMVSDDARAVFVAYGGLFSAVRRLLQPDGQPAAQPGLDARTHLLLSHVHWLRVWLLRFEPTLHLRAAHRTADLVLHGLPGAGQGWPDAAVLDRVRVPQLLQLPGEAGAGNGFDAAFLQAATALVNEHGYHGASIDRIAARLQRSKGSVYHHHDTKLDLISACYDRSHALTRQALLAAEAAPGTVWQRVCGAAAALLRFQLSPQGPLLRASAYNALPDAAALRRVRQQRRLLRERLMHLLADGLADASLRPHDISLGAPLLANAIDRAASLRLWVPALDAEAALGCYLRPALLGLLAAD